MEAFQEPWHLVCYAISPWDVPRSQRFKKQKKKMCLTFESHLSGRSGIDTGVISGTIFKHVCNYREPRHVKEGGKTAQHF